MKCLILAAGYATRLYPLTENFPKPLLEVGGKTILDWLIDDIDSLGAINEYVVISNHKFADIFTKWARTKNQKVTVVDDGTSTNDTRLGAVCDIKYTVDKLNVDDDCLIIAGDNLLDFSLTDFVKYAVGKGASAVMRYYEPTTAKLQKSGVLTLDETDRVLEMQEKPIVPNSNWCCPPFYFYIKDDMKKIGQAISDGCGTDAPGSLVAWMCKQNTVYAMEMPGKRYDIGDVKSYEEVCANYRGISK